VGSIRQFGRRASGAVVAAFVVAAFVAPPAAATVTPSRTLFSYNVPSGALPGNVHGTGEFSPADSSFTVGGTNRQVYAHLHRNDGTNQANVIFQPADGDILHPGVYANAAPTPRGRLPMLEFALDRTDCIGSGRFAINQIGFDANGNVNLLDVDVVEHCLPSPQPAIKATLLYNAFPLSVTVRGAKGDSVSGGLHVTYVNSTSILVDNVEDATVGSPVDEATSFLVLSKRDTWRFILYPMRGKPITPGTFPLALSPDATHVGLYIARDANVCATFATGTVTIHSVIRFGSALLIWMDFDWRCGAEPPGGGITGTLHFLQ
jgi:hypothetical protein